MSINTSTTGGNYVVDDIKSLFPEPYGPKVRRCTPEMNWAKEKQKSKRRARNKAARRSRRINRRK